MPPPKGKDKGAAKGKQGTQLKDILPANAKQPREGQPVEPLEEPTAEGILPQDRKYEYLPYPDFPVWPGNQEVQTVCDQEKHAIIDSIQKEKGDGADASDEEDNLTLPEDKLFSDDYKFFLPPSFHEFERRKIKWLRPKEYLYEIMAENDKSLKKGKAGANRKRRTSKRLRSNSKSGITEFMNSDKDVGGVGKKKKQKVKVQYKVIGYQERPETEDEIRRRKEEEEKLGGKDKKKAPAKKGIEEEEPIQMVRVAIETNMDMGFLMPTYAKWITSQIQFIKDRTIRDNITKEPVWKRIYPQENGIPVKSLNGKYRVKVRFMGKERLVEIDDKMPCDIKNKLMYPRTTDFTEIWPQLLIKAFFKLYSFKWYPGATYDRETGDSSIVYALTGLIGERVKINDFHKESMNLLRKNLSDDHYFGNKTYVMCYCGPTFTPKIPSQLPGGKITGPGITNTSQNSSILGPNISIASLGQTQKQKLAQKFREIASIALSITSGKKLSAAIYQKQRQSYVIPCFGYALVDLFENKDVDMDTIIKKPESSEMKSPFASPSRTKRKNKSPSPQMNKTMSPLKKKSKKKGKGGATMKTRAQSEFKSLQRKAPPIQYKLLKVKTSVGNYPILNVNPPFTNSEITLAKKCRLNEWQNPPPELDPNFVPTRAPVKGKKEFKLDISPTREHQNESKEEVEKEGEEEGDQEEKKVYEPRTRAPGGIWLQASDFPFCFQYFIVYHNDEKIENRLVKRDIWSNSKIPYKVNEEDIYIRIRDKKEEEMKGEEEHKIDANVNPENDAFKNIDDFEKDDKKRVLVGFSPNPNNQALDKLPRYYCRMNLEMIDPPLVKSPPQNDLRNPENNNIVLSELAEEDEDSTGEVQEQVQNKKNSIDVLFSNYFSGQLITFDNNPKIILKPQMYAPLGY